MINHVNPNPRRGNKNSDNQMNENSQQKNIMVGMSDVD